MRNERFRFIYAVCMFFGGIVLSFIFGGLLYIFSQNKYLEIVWFIYKLFFAFSALTALLIIIFPKIEDQALGYGAGIYYGGLFTEIIFENIGLTNYYFAGYLVSVLVSIIVYQRNRQYS